MNLKYKAIALDLDGTLLKSDKTISEKTCGTIIEYQKAGGHVIVATGRPDAGALHFCEQLSMRQYGGILLSYNGGKIENLTNGDLIVNLLLPDGTVWKAARVIDELDDEKRMNLATYRERELYCDVADNRYVKLEEVSSRLRLILTDRLFSQVDFPVNKCLVGGDGEYLAVKEPLVAAAMGDGVDVYRSDPYFIEIVPKGVDKTAGLRRIAEYLHITMEEMAAFGDGFNDVSMVKNAGFGVAMANAQDIVKQAADYVTLSNDEDGVSDAILKCVMKN